MQLEMPKPWTVRPDGLTSVRPDGLTSRKYRQKHKIFVKVGSQFCQILNSYSRNGQKLLKCCPIGEISPNHVTLLLPIVEWFAKRQVTCWVNQVPMSCWKHHTTCVWPENTRRRYWKWENREKEVWNGPLKINAFYIHCFTEMAKVKFRLNRPQRLFQRHKKQRRKRKKVLPHLLFPKTFTRLNNN